MYSTLFFDPISIPVPRANIYRRLGYRKGITRIIPSQQEENERYIVEAQSLIHLKGTGVRVSIQKKGTSEIILPGDIHFESRKLSKFLDHCQEIIIMGATAGDTIMESIQEDAAGRNVMRGVVFDATASETVDAALDWIMDYFSRSLRRENKRLLKRRFSAGYGDFLLENQRSIYKVLQLDRLGVRITEDCILIPEKSVTAITGIELISDSRVVT
jgi:hypothetical protein